MYIKDEMLFKELLISKGKGKLTELAEVMIIDICDKMFYKLNKTIRNEYRYDVYMNGVETILNQWNKFNPSKYDKSLPFISEVIKRGFADGYNKIVKWRSKGVNVNMIRLEF